MCGTGPVIVLPNKFADEIRNNPGLEFNKGIKEVSAAICHRM
jgi:hypothetical protein